MWYKNIKLILIGFLFFAVSLIVGPVYANVPDVSGYVLTTGTNAPVGNVWVKMTMSGCPWASTPRSQLLPQSRYTKTDSNGYYLFEALSESQVAAEMGKSIDTDFDGINDAIEFPTYDDCYYDAPAVNTPSQLIWLFGCGRDPYLITVVKPYNWSGQFTSTGELSLLNTCPVGYCIDNNQPAKPVPTLYWKGTSTAPTRTPTPTPTKTPTPTRTPTPTPSACGATDIILVLDRSGSMTAEAATQKTAVHDFINKVQSYNSPSVRIGIISFGASVWPPTYGLPFPYNTSYSQSSLKPTVIDIPLSSDYAQLHAAVDALSSPDEGTCVECGLYLANQKLKQDQPTNQKFVVVMTDGITDHMYDGTNDPTAATSEMNSQATQGKNSGIKYYVFQYDLITSGLNLQSMASGPTYYSYENKVPQWPTVFNNFANSICKNNPLPNTPTPTINLSSTTTPTPTVVQSSHLSCSGISCQAVSGAGPDTCLPEGDSCQQTTTGCPSTCGDFGTVTQSCSCSGPCCPGTCRNGLSCGETKSVACCNSRSPTFPSNVSITQPSGGAIIQTRTVKIDWTFANTVGCGNAWGFNCSGNTNLSFKIVIDDDQYFNSPLITKIGIPSTARTYTTTAADGFIKDNKKYYVKVCAVNYKETCTIVSFTKQPYPVGIVIGSVGEFDNQSAQPFTNNGASGSITINTAPPVTAGITTSCSKTTGGTPPATQSYNCNITLDNINFDPVPNQQYTITASGYNSSMYTGVCSQNGANCTQPVAIGINFDANAGTPPNITHNIYFSMNSSLAFFKIKNGSIQTHNSAAWSAFFPVSTLPFDSQDYTVGGNFLIIGDTAASYNAVGTALFTNPISLGTALTSQKTAPYPPGKNWMSEGYLPVTAFNAQRYIEYVKTRKQYQTITRLKDLKSGIINVWNGDLIIDKNNSDQSGRNNFNAKNIVLVVTGSVSFNTDDFTPNASTAIIADTINFFSGTTYVTKAEGVFIGNSINFGSSNTPIKITGNVASTQNSIALSRIRDDHRIPSVFVVYNITPYVDLLPQLSTALYEWKQLQ